MSIEGKVSLTLSIEKDYRDRLRFMAAHQNMYDPDNLTSASSLARGIICEYLDSLERMEVQTIKVHSEEAVPTEKKTE